MTLVNTGLMGITMVLVLLVVALLRVGKNKPVARREVPLAQLSGLWVKGRITGEVHIAEIAPIWRDDDQAKSEQKHYVFRTERIMEFFEKHVVQAPWFSGAALQQETCCQILLMLEKEGDCSSVVSAADDVEGSWNSNTFTLLGQTSLLDHSLHVAEEAIKLLLDEDASHVIPDTLVAALGHDLGKLPSIKGHLYSIGEHPLAAGRVLAEIESFRQLARKDEISMAIKLHHKRPEGLLGKTLKKADQLARQKELENAADRIPRPEAGLLPAGSLPATPLTSTGSKGAWQAHYDIYGGGDPPGKSKEAAPNLIDISTWFNAQAFMDFLKPYINRVSGRRFMAFSMPDGYVYFQVKALEEVARRQAELAGAMDIATMAADDLTMREVLYTVVHHLRVEHEVIARELVKDQYFGGYFTITTKGGNTITGYYTPFHAEAFGSIAEMEAEKTGLLRNFKNVEPRVNNE
jgi:hypothetical protein